MILIKEGIIMRINIDISLGEAILPRDNRPYFLSLIKKVLSENCSELYKKLYDSGATPMKNMCFATKFSQPKFEGDSIFLIDKEILMSISTSDSIFGIDLYNSFLTIKNKKFPILDKNYFLVKSVRIENTQQIKSDKIIITMISPLVVRSHEKGRPDKYYIYDEAGFADAFFEVTKNQLEKLAGVHINYGDITIAPVKARKTVERAFNVNVRCSLGQFVLAGKPEILEFLYQTGIGSKRSQGNGMFNIIG